MKEGVIMKKFDITPFRKELEKMQEENKTAGEALFYILSNLESGLYTNMVKYMCDISVKTKGQTSVIIEETEEGSGKWVFYKHNFDRHKDNLLEGDGKNGLKYHIDAISNFLE